MINKDTENDLLLGNELNNSSDVQYLKEIGALDNDIQTIREIVDGFDPKKLDMYNDGLLYKAYYAAKRCKTMSKNIIAKQLCMSVKLLNYYLDKYPKLGLALQAGYMDSLETMKENLVTKLYESAMGTTVVNTSKTTNYVINEFGDRVPVNETVTEHEINTVPSVSAQLELLKRLDPAWVPKVQIDVTQQINQNFKVQEDINVAVDYRKLSVGALKELLASGKADLEDDTNLKKEDLDTRKELKEIKLKESGQPAKRRGRPPKNKNKENE